MDFLVFALISVVTLVILLINDDEFWREREKERKKGGGGWMWGKRWERDRERRNRKQRERETIFSVYSDDMMG